CLHSIHQFKLFGIFLLADTRKPGGLSLRVGQPHWASRWSSGRHARYISRWGCAHGNVAPLLSWCFITRWRCRCRRWLLDRPVRLSLLPVATRRNTEMAFQGWDKIGLVPTLAVAITFERCGINLGLRYVIVGIAILRMLSQPFLNLSGHRGLLRLLLLLRLSRILRLRLLRLVG